MNNRTVPPLVQQFRDRHRRHNIPFEEVKEELAEFPRLTRRTFPVDQAVSRRDRVPGQIWHLPAQQGHQHGLVHPQPPRELPTHLEHRRQQHRPPRRNHGRMVSTRVL